MTIWKTWISVGALVRGDVRDQLRKAALGYNVEIIIDEEKRWLESTLFISVSGEEDNVNAYRKAISKWIEEIS